MIGWFVGITICALYSTTAELTREVAEFWLTGSGVTSAAGTSGRDTKWLAPRCTAEVGIDATAEARRGLTLMCGDGAYVVHGMFNPEVTMQVFNDAIEQAYTEGFTGFRAAAEMSWTLDCEDGADQVILYEALLKSLFASSGGSACVSTLANECR